MKSLSLLFMITVLFAFQPSVLPAAESKSEDWRTRVSVADRDTYSESDTDEELNFGREIAARLLGQFRVSGNVKLQRYVNLVGKTLAQNCSRP
jgi:predicted Zn-dependent protease